MITGFNTDIEYEGVVYHVQTEDKGLNSPLILSLVYSGGAILASKRTPYQDLLSAGFDEELLAERLKRQHRLICAAIRAGRMDELKRMNSRPESAPLPRPPQVQVERDEDLTVEIPAQATEVERGPVAEASSTDETSAQAVDLETGTAAEASTTERPKPQASVADAYSIYDPRRQVPSKEHSGSAEGLQIRILDEQDFQAGDSLSLRVMVGFRSGGKEKPKAGVPVSVKVLGTTFRPQIYSVKTQRDGVAIFPVQIPAFASGRAAILVRAAVGSDAVELRRVVHSAQ